MLKLILFGLCSRFGCITPQPSLNAREKNEVFSSLPKEGIGCLQYRCAFKEGCGVMQPNLLHKPNKISFNIHLSTLSAKLQSLTFIHLRMALDNKHFSKKLYDFQSYGQFVKIFGPLTAKALGNTLLKFQQLTLKTLRANYKNAP